MSSSSETTNPTGAGAAAPASSPKYKYGLYPIFEGHAVSWNSPHVMDRGAKLAKLAGNGGVIDCLFDEVTTTDGATAKVLNFNIALYLDVTEADHEPGANGPVQIKTLSGPASKSTADPDTGSSSTAPPTASLMDEMSHLYLFCGPAAALGSFWTANGERIEHNLPAMLMTSPANHKTRWSNRKFRVSWVPSLDTAFTSAVANAPLGLADCVFKEETGDKDESCLVNIVTRFYQTRARVGIIFNVAIAGVRALFVDMESTPTDKEVRKAGSQAVSALFASNRAVWKGFSVGQGIAKVTIDRAVTAVTAAKRADVDKTIFSPFVHDGDQEWVPLGTPGMYNQAVRIVRGLPEETEGPTETYSMDDARLPHRQVRIGVFNTRPSDVDPLREDKLYMGYFVPTGNHKNLERAIANEDVFQHGVMMRHVGGRTFEFCMTVPVETNHLKLVSKVRAWGVSDSATHPTQQPAFVSIPQTNPAVGTQGTGTAVPSPDSRASLQLGGIASVDPGARTLATIYLPHLRSYVHFGVGLAEHVEQQQAVAKDLALREQLACSMLTQLHSAPKAQVCKALKIDDNERKLRTKALHAELARLRKKIAGIINDLDDLLRLHHVKIEEFLGDNARFVVFPKFNWHEVSRTRANVDKQHAKNVQEAVARGATQMPAKGRPSYLNRATKRQLAFLSLARLRHRVFYGLGLRGTSVFVVGEEYTSQMCGVCSHLTKVPGKVYECKVCKVVMERDENGARNILIKFLTNLSMHGLGHLFKFISKPRDQAMLLVGSPRGRVVKADPQYHKNTAGDNVDGTA